MTESITSATPLNGETPAPIYTPTVYPLSFTGVGSEYFKIWIVNLLLILITLGLYYPWAKLRKQKYLHRNLILDGAAFDYHAKPKALFMGMAVALVLSGVYFLMSQLESVPALIIITLGLSALVPWLIWKAFRFRLAMTSYRALPFKFVGGLKDAYVMIVPQFLLLGYLNWVMIGIKVDAAEGVPPTMKWLGLVYILLFMFVPALHLFLKKYQHNNYQWTSLQSRLDLGYGAMYLEYLKLFGMFLLSLVGFFILIALIMGLVGGMGFAASLMSESDTPLGVPLVVLGSVVGALAYTAVYAFIVSQFTTRFQNIVWNQTTAQGIVFKSELKTWALFKLYFKNVVLTLLTLGIYWPFAAMKVAQLRAASISMHADAPLMALAAAHLGEAREQNAVGDAVGDVFGIDIAM